MTDIAVQAMEALQSCRCCLRRPPEKGLRTIYENVGKSEVYWDMLKECFNIHLNLGNEECGICEVCVAKLREANEFKHQVQQSQIDLKSLLERALAEKDKKPDFVKVEIVEVDPISDSLLSSNDPKKEFKSESDGDLVSNLSEFCETELTEYTWLDVQNDSSSASFECLACQKAFDNKESLTRHTFAVHAKNDHAVLNKRQIFPCNICCEWFTHKHDLTQHMNNHKTPQEETQERITPKCDSSVQTNINNLPQEVHEQCTKKEPSKIAAKKRVYKEDREYTCPVCKKVFKSNNSLEIHMRSLHTRKKTHKCELCRKTFKFQFSLNLHLKTHNAEKLSYSCDKCKMRFSRQSSLNSHMRSHIGQKSSASRV